MIMENKKSESQNQGSEISYILKLPQMKMYLFNVLSSSFSITLPISLVRAVSKRSASLRETVSSIVNQ